MSSVAQARGGLMGAGVTGKPVWVALSGRDDDGTRLRSGELVSDVIPLLEEYDPAAPWEFNIKLFDCEYPYSEPSLLLILLS